MSQSNSNNISISSLLDSGSSSSHQQEQPQQQGTTSSFSGNNRNVVSGSQRPVAISEMVSKYKTSFNLTNDDPEIIVISDTPTPRVSRKTSPGVASKPPLLPRTKSKTPSHANTKSQQAQSGNKGTTTSATTTSATATSAFVSDQVKKFKTSFQLNPVNTSPSKTSINSIINIDDDGQNSSAPRPAPRPTPQTSSTPSPVPDSTANGNKRKRNIKLFDPKKRRSGSPASTESPKQSPAPTQAIAPAPITTKSSTPSTQPVKIQPSIKNGAASTKPVSRSSSTLKPPSQQLQKSPVIDKKTNATSTTTPEVSKSTAPSTTVKNDPVIKVKVSAPTVIDLLNVDDVENEVVEISKKEKIDTTATTEKSPDKAKEKEKVKEKENEKEKEKEKQQEAPIIALDIPLLDPKNPQPGKAEVIVNVLKLAEEKYGWSVMHPNSKNALDMMDDMIDDEDDDDNDEDEDIVEVADTKVQPQSSSSSGTSGGTKETPQLNSKGKELSEEQLYRQHEVKMIRKVGKYDFEDPFIDDEELQIEEDISSTKEGFFVYWGPLVDEKTATKIKKKR